MKTPLEQSLEDIINQARTEFQQAPTEFQTNCDHITIDFVEITEGTDGIITTKKYQICKLCGVKI